MQQGVQVFGNRGARLLNGAWITPAQAGAIEPAGPRELRDLLLKDQILIAGGGPSRNPE